MSTKPNSWVHESHLTLRDTFLSGTKSDLVGAINQDEIKWTATKLLIYKPDGFWKQIWPLEVAYSPEQGLSLVLLP